MNYEDPRYEVTYLDKYKIKWIYGLAHSSIVSDPHSDHKTVWFFVL
jgi:hypothetical protein